MKKGLSLILILSVLLTAGCSAAVEPSEPAAGSSVVSEPVNSGAAAPASSPDAPAAKVDARTTPAADSAASTSAPAPAAVTDAPPAEPAATDAHAKPAATYGPHDIGGVEKSEAADGAILAEAGGAAGDWAYDAAADIAFADAAEPSVAGADGCGDIWIEPPYEEPQIPPEAGLLTGGEWRDNDHWTDWNELYGTHSSWEQFKSDWRVSYEMRIAVTVTSGGQPVEGARVSCPNAVAEAVTDNKGRAYLFYTAINGPTEPITAQYGGVSASADGVLDNGAVEIELDGAPAAAEKKLDFMIMCDTTGSMWDELSYLQEELKDIITRVQADNANIPTRLSVNFYRDEGDEYVVREYPFTTDISEACEAIAQQSAEGGGDFPEAVHTALDSAINGHDWDEDSVKILFLVLDAPPHEDIQTVDSVNYLIRQASEKGIRIIPIASSGIDKSTEYLLRTMAFTTGGTYTFLTDNSGIGGSHIEPTVGAYNVEKLNDMMVRIVNGYLD